MDDSIAILLVSDDPFSRAGLAMLLDSLPRCEVVGQTSTATIDDVDLETVPTLILYDGGWVAEPLETDWGVPMLALVADMESATAVWQQAPTSLLPRDMDGDKLEVAIHATMQGLIVIDPLFIGVQQGDSLLANGQDVDLTPRETEVLQELAYGLTNRAIAQKMEISTHTVKFHVNAILSKLNAQSRTEAVVRATQRGWLSL